MFLDSGELFVLRAVGDLLVEFNESTHGKLQPSRSVWYTLDVWYVFTPRLGLATIGWYFPFEPCKTVEKIRL